MSPMSMTDSSQSHIYTTCHDYEDHNEHELDDDTTCIGRGPIGSE